MSDAGAAKLAATRGTLFMFDAILKELVGTVPELPRLLDSIPAETGITFARERLTIGGDWEPIPVAAIAVSLPSYRDDKKGIQPAKRRDITIGRGPDGISTVAFGGNAYKTNVKGWQESLREHVMDVAAGRRAIGAEIANTVDRLPADWGMRRPRDLVPA